MAQRNNVHIINLTAKRTRTAISSSWSQQIVIPRKDGARIRRAEATMLTSAITREIVAVALPLTVKVQKMKRSLRTGIRPAVIQSFAVNVKGEK